MIDLKRNDVISLREACSVLPRLRGGRRPHVSTLWRWAHRGVRGDRLEVAALGGTTVTTRAALQRFLEDVTAARAGNAKPSARWQHGRDEVYCRSERV